MYSYDSGCGLDLSGELSYRAFSRDVTRSKLIKNGRHFGHSTAWIFGEAGLPQYGATVAAYIEALGAELVGKENQPSCVKSTLAKLKPSGEIRPKFKRRVQNYHRVLCVSKVDGKLPRLIHYGAG